MLDYKGLLIDKIELEGNTGAGIGDAVKLQVGA